MREKEWAEGEESGESKSEQREKERLKSEIVWAERERVVSQVIQERDWAADTSV